MKFIDLFAGIGGFRLGMESEGHKCVAFCEIDKFARASYKAIHDTEGEIEYHDITSVTDEQWSKFRGTVDVICGGFPCQAFSVAGKRQGFLDETRGTLFFEIARAAKQIKPRILFLENVKGLLSHDKGRTFGTILNTLDELGYDCEWQVLNSKNFGVPQNRERVFIIGHSRGERGREVFPITGQGKQSTNEPNIEILGSTKPIGATRSGQRDLVYKADGLMGCLAASDYKQPKQISVYHKSGDFQSKIIVKEATKKGYAVANVGDSVNISHPNSKTRRGRVGKQVAQTLDTSCNQAVIVQNPLKGKTKNGWHFEQNVFDVEGLARTLKAGGGSGNIPKIIQKPRGFNKGGGREPKIITGQPIRIYGKRQVNYKLSDTVGTLLASQYKNGDTQPKVVIPVLTPDRAEKRQNGRRFKENNEEMFTLTAQDRHGVLIEQLDEITKKSRPNEKIEYTFKENGDIRPHRMDTRKSGISELNINHEENPSHTVTTSHAPKVYGESTEYRIRKLTPRECWRLQGFPDWAFDKAQEVNSNSQLYKQAGNSVTVNVIAEISRRLEDV